MIAILSLLTVLSVSFLVVRIGAIALTMTGLSDEVARFQALSAFTGAGFTTGESENVVNGPSRRRIVAWLIRLGSAGIVTVLSTVMIGVVGDEYPTWEKLLVLAGGLAVIVYVARSDRLDRVTRPLIERALRDTAALELRDYAGLLHLREDWRVAEAEVLEGSRLASGPLRTLGLRERGVVVLGIEHADGGWTGAPKPDTTLRPGDIAILYGQSAVLERISEGRASEPGG